MTHLLKNVRISIRKPSKQTASKSDHFEFFTYVYRRKKTQKSKFEKKKNANKSQKMCWFRISERKTWFKNNFCVFWRFPIFFHVFCQKIGQKIFQKKFHLHIWNLWFFCDFSSNFHGNRRKLIFWPWTLYRKKCP